MIDQTLSVVVVAPQNRLTNGRLSGDLERPTTAPDKIMSS